MNVCAATREPEAMLLTQMFNPARALPALRALLRNEENRLELNVYIIGQFIYSVKSIIRLISKLILLC